MKKYLLTILIIIFIIGAIYFVFKFYSGVTPKVCTQETKQCPNGGYVSRSSFNNCEFAQCPGLETEAIMPKTWTVEYKENIFIPKELKIKKGDTVIWVNNHSEPVWPASAFHPTHQVYQGFNAFKGIKTGESFSFTFDKVGSWKYHDHLSPGVTGVIIVEE